MGKRNPYKANPKVQSGIQTAARRARFAQREHDINMGRDPHGFQLRVDMHKAEYDHGVHARSARSLEQRAASLPPGTVAHRDTLAVAAHRRQLATQFDAEHSRAVSRYYSHVAGGKAPKPKVTPAASKIASTVGKITRRFR